MADRYAVATGNWNSTSTWSATSGGASGASVPIAGDTANLDNASYTVSVNASVSVDKVLVSAGILSINNIRVLTLVTGNSIISGTGALIATAAGTGTIRLNTPAQLRLTGTGAFAGGTTGTLIIAPTSDTIPAISDVRNGVVYGPTDTLTGTLVVPSVGDVRAGTVFDNRSIGTLMAGAGDILGG